MRVRYQAAPHPEKENILSGWQDSNLRPPAPKAGAITGLRYTPKRNLNRGQYFNMTAKKLFSSRKTVCKYRPLHTNCKWFFGLVAHVYKEVVL
jgi:hypothetical protein